MTDSFIPINGTPERLQTYKRTVNGVEVHAEVVAMGQLADAGNSAVRTDATQFVGTWKATRSEGYVRQLTVLAALDSTGAPNNTTLGGTFIFEYSDDGTTATIIETRTITDFETVRDFDLLNAGNYYRCKFTPSRALTGSEAVIISTTHRSQNDGAFVRLANQETEEANVAMGNTFAYLKAFKPNGKSTNIRASSLGDLNVRDTQLFVSESGSLDTESIRDDISIIFARDEGAANILSTVITDLSSGGTVTHDATEGRAVFSTTSTAGRTSYFQSVDVAKYEPGHMIRGEWTVEVSPALAGTAKVEWGYGENNGSGDVLNGIGWGMDVTGLYTFRKKAGSYASKVYKTAFNRDLLDGGARSRFISNNLPVAFDSTKNNLYLVGFEWLGVASPIFRIQAPAGQFVTAHVEETSGTITGTTIPEPQLPMFVRVSNGNQATNYTASCGSWRGGIYTSLAIPPTISEPLTSQKSVTSSATLAIDKRAGRKVVALSNRTDSNRSLFYGFTSGVTTSSGFELAAGATADRAWGPNVQVWVIQAGGAGTVTACIDEGI